MAYESPIQLVTEIENKIIEDEKEGVYKAVLAYKIDISKDELFKLLYGDRKQYDKGFADGYAKGTADAEPRRCEDCKHGTETDYKDVYFCRLGNGLHHRTFYCGNAERKDKVEE